MRQRDAHAWAEVWLEGQGWVRVDPTSAVSPGRTGTLQRLQPAPSFIGGALLDTVNPVFALQMRAMWDAMNNGWNQWILNYTEGKQLNLLSQLGFESPTWEDLIYVLAGLLGMCAMGGAVWAVWQHQREDPWRSLLSKAELRLIKMGVKLPPQCPPRQMAQQMEQQLGAVQPGLNAIREWLIQLEIFRYAPAADHTSAKNRMAKLKRDFKQLPWPL